MAKPLLNDKKAVNNVAAAVGHSLAHWVFTIDRGDLYVLGDEHYTKLTTGGAIFVSDKIPEYPMPMADFIEERLTDPKAECKGFVPATESALNALKGLGLEVIVGGLGMRRVPGYADGSKVDVYNKPL